MSCVLVSCDKVPNTSVFEPIDTKTLGEIFKNDTSFIKVYEHLQSYTVQFNEIDRARFSDITYRGVNNMFKLYADTVKINPMEEKWEKEWYEKYEKYEVQADSAIKYWKGYIEKNSLSRFVKIEFDHIDKDYYEYIHEVKEVDLGFKITPIDGPIEQLCFNYKYCAKINDINYADKHNCICTSPIHNSVVRYWKVEYSDEKRLQYVSTSDFIRDYDIVFEITEIRKDGVNYSQDDWKIPTSVRIFLDRGCNKGDVLYDYYLSEVIKDLIYKDYLQEYEYVSYMKDEYIKSKYPREFEFENYK